jgi:TolB-like protein
MKRVTSGRLFRELRRRRLFNTIAFYIVGAWVALQVADLAFPGIGIPESAIGIVWLGAFALFPLVLVFGWRYDLTRGGIRRTPPAGTPAKTALAPTDHWLISGLSLAALAVLAGMLVRIAEVEPDAVVVAPENSIAVLPFEVCETYPRDQALAHQLANEVLNRLAERGTIKVIARTTSFNLSRVGWTTPQISRQLGVRYVLAGELCRNGDTLTMAAELSDGDGFIVQRGLYEQVVNPYGQIEQRLASQVADSVAAEMGDLGWSQKDSPVNRLAYEQLLIGREYIVLREWKKADEAIARALELQPDYAEALFEKALLEWGHGHSLKWIVRAKNAKEIANSALALAQTQVEQGAAGFDAHLVIGKIQHSMAHLEEGLVYRQAAQMDQEELARRQERIRLNFEDAERHLRSAALLNPSTTEVYSWLADTLEHLGGQRRAEALEVLELGLERDPFNANFNERVAFRLAERGQFRQAMELLDRFKALPDGMLWWTRLEILNNLGRYDEKLATQIEILQTAPGAYENKFVLGHLYWLASQIADLGMAEEAEVLYRQLEKIPFPRDDWVYDFFLANMYLESTGSEDLVIASRLAKVEGMSNEEILNGWHLSAQIFANDFWRTGERDRATELYESLRHTQWSPRWAERQTGAALILVEMFLDKGREADALPLLKETVAYLEAEVDAGIRHPETLGLLAQAYARLGRDDESLDMLGKSVDYGNWWSVDFAEAYFAFSTNWFDRLIEDPRFIAQQDRRRAMIDQQSANIRSLLTRHDMEALLVPVVALWADKANSPVSADGD